jgi:hypothetical protein
VAAARLGAGEVFGDFIEMHVTMIDLDKKLHRAL